MTTNLETGTLKFPSDDAPIDEIALFNLRWALDAYRRVKAATPRTPSRRLRFQRSWVESTQSNRDEIRACIKELRDARTRPAPCTSRRA